MPQHIRILLVEDNPRDAELIERELRRGSLDVSTERVQDEIELRSALDSMDPDVILCDYNLPGFDGIEALKIASELVPDIPLIFVSGSIGEERAVQTLREGAVDYVLKDRLSRLPSAITRALDERRERQLRRRAQEALLRSEERFQYAAKATQDVIWDWNVLTDKIWFNDALRTVWGYRIEPDYVSSEWRESLIHPQDRERVRSAFRSALASNERLSDEYRFQRSGGRYCEVMESSLFIRDAKGRAVRVISAMIDLSERAAAEETIRRLNHQNELILTSAAEAILSVDREGKVSVVNPAALRMTGFSAVEFCDARSMHDLVHYAHADASEYPRELCPLMTSVSNGKPLTSEDMFFRKTGEPFPVEYSCSPIRENGEIAGSVIIFQDITARKRLEKKIQQTERVASLGRVAATIAHEFNNVLMGIQPFAEIVRRNAKEEKLQKAATQILGSVARGKRVTDEILRFTQPAEPAMQTVVLNEWIQQLLPEFGAVIGDRIRVVTELSPEPVTVRCDSAQMQQVVMNLVVNSRDAMQQGGTLTIRTAVSNGMGLLTVRDTGMGMPPEILQNIFEPLFTTKRSGTGLGLAVAHQVIARHGGSIHAESTPGAGTVFEILLPLATATTQAEEKSAQQSSSVSSIVLVEDEPGIAAGIVALLQEHGIGVEHVQRGAEAIDAIAHHRPDAVILDVTLPDMSGFAVYDEVARRWPQLPVVFSSGHGDEKSVSLESAPPANVAFLRKPYDSQKLLDALENLTASVQR